MEIFIDNQSYEVKEGSTVLDATRAAGIRIPALCYHPALKPSASCKLCAVEITGKTGRPTPMLSCLVRVKAGMQIKTDTPMVQEARTAAFQRLLHMAPQSKRLLDMAREFRIDLGPPPDGCVRCKLCVRVCSEIVGVEALKMIKRDGREYITPIEGRCIGCGTCSNICPTGAISLTDDDNVRTLRIRDEVIGRHPLERCEGCGKLFATPGFLNYVNEHSQQHPDVKEHHNYCPTCAKLFSNRIASYQTRSQKQILPGHHI